MDHLEALFGCKSPLLFHTPFSSKVYRFGITKRIAHAASHLCSHFDSKYFLVLWFSSKKLSSHEETWQTANFLCFVISHEEQGLIRDKTPRSTTGRDKQDVYKGSISWEKRKKWGNSLIWVPTRLNSVGSLLLSDFWRNNTETACSGAEMYNRLAIPIRTALNFPKKEDGLILTCIGLYASPASLVSLLVWHSRYQRCRECHTLAGLPALLSSGNTLKRLRRNIFSTSLDNYFTLNPFQCSPTSISMHATLTSHIIRHQSPWQTLIWTNTGCKLNISWASKYTLCKRDVYSLLIWCL